MNHRKSIQPPIELCRKRRDANWKRWAVDNNLYKSLSVSLGKNIYVITMTTMLKKGEFSMKHSIQNVCIIQRVNLRTTALTWGNVYTVSLSPFGLSYIKMFGPRQIHSHYTILYWQSAYWMRPIWNQCTLYREGQFFYARKDKVHANTRNHQNLKLVLTECESTQFNSTRLNSIDFYASFALHHRKIDVIPFHFEQITIFQSALFLFSFSFPPAIDVFVNSTYLLNVRSFYVCSHVKCFTEYGENSTILK